MKTRLNLFFCFLVCGVLSAHALNVSVPNVDQDIAERVFGSYIFDLDFETVEIGTVSETPFEPHRTHNAFRIVCGDDPPQTCKFCVGQNYPNCNGGNVCGTKDKYRFEFAHGAGTAKKIQDPAMTYCSKKICNGMEVYCGADDAEEQFVCEAYQAPVFEVEATLEEQLDTQASY